MASVRKRTWTGPDGKPGEAWCVEYSVEGKRKRATAKSGLKKDAEKLRQKIEAEIEGGVHTTAGDTMTVAKFCEEFLVEIDQRERDGRIVDESARKRRIIVRKHLAPVLGHVRLTDLKPAHVRKLYNAMRESGVAPFTAKGYLRYCSHMERHARKLGYMRNQPFTEALDDFYDVRPEPIRVFTLDEVKTLLATAETLAPRQTMKVNRMVKCAVHLAAFCGLRNGEVFGLTRESIDLQNRMLRIRTNMTPSGLKKRLKTAAGKRDIPIPPHLVEMLAEYLHHFYVANDDQLVFTVNKPTNNWHPGKTFGPGRRMHRETFYTQWRRLLHRAGICDMEAGKAIHFHALRHFASALMLEHRIPLTDIAGLMGHKSYDTTLQVYAHSIVGGEKRHATFERMADGIRPTPETVAKTINAPKTRQIELKPSEAFWHQ